MNNSKLLHINFIIGTNVTVSNTMFPFFNLQKDLLNFMHTIHRDKQRSKFCYRVATAYILTSLWQLLLLKHLSAKAMLHLSPSTRYYLYTGHTDMRKGFDSLCGIVSSQMRLDALSGAVFIFINKKRTQVKLLLWEGDGLSVYYKRLEKGTYERPASDENGTSTVLSYQQLQFILQGVALQKISYRRRYQKIA